MRAQFGAIYQLALNLLGIGLGPTAVALFTDYVFMDEMMVRYTSYENLAEVIRHRFTDPEATLRVVETMSECIADLVQMVADLSLRTVEARLARLC